MQPQATPTAEPALRYSRSKPFGLGEGDDAKIADLVRALVRRQNNQTADSAPPLPRFLTVAEAAALLRVDDATVSRAIRANEFPAVKLRRRYVIPSAAINRIADEAISSGRCIDIAEWTEAWRNEIAAGLESGRWTPPTDYAAGGVS